MKRAHKRTTIQTWGKKLIVSGGLAVVVGIHTGGLSPESCSIFGYLVCLVKQKDLQNIFLSYSHSELKFCNYTC